MLQIQGLSGAAQAVKPTDLLVVNATEACEEVLLAARSTALPKKGVIGLDAERKWRTAPLKEYPPLFCAVLAKILSESQRLDGEVAPQPTAFLEEIAPLLADFNTSAEMGEDYGNRRKADA